MESFHSKEESIKNPGIQGNLSFPDVSSVQTRTSEFLEEEDLHRGPTVQGKDSGVLAWLAKSLEQKALEENNYLLRFHQGVSLEEKENMRFELEKLNFAMRNLLLEKGNTSLREEGSLSAICEEINKNYKKFLDTYQYILQNPDKISFKLAQVKKSTGQVRGENEYRIILSTWTLDKK